jgi:kumamolisin
LRFVVVLGATVLSVGAIAQSPVFAESARQAPVLANNARQARITPTPANPSQKITFYWWLKRDDAGAARLARRVSDPRNSMYRQFLTAREVASRFGATQATVTKVRAYAARKKLSSRLDKSRLFLRVDGTVAAFNSAFGQPILTGVTGNRQIFAPTTNPTLPKPVRALVPQPNWQYMIQLPGPASDPLASKLMRRVPPPENLGTMTGCAALATGNHLQKYMMSGAQEATAYGTAALAVRNRSTSRGDVVVHPPIGVLAQGSGFSDTYLSQATACQGVSGTAARVETDGMIGPLPSGVEGNLDIQMVLTQIAGRYRVPVYESLFPDNAMAPVAALNSLAVPRVLTTSYGIACEPELSPVLRKFNDAVFMRLGLVGTSVLAASGDSGSSGCVNQDSPPGPQPKGLAVFYPASSPWVTSVGGTRIVLTTANTRADEVTWNDSPWIGSGSGGGGTSILYSRPWWQSAQVTGSIHRTVPDISAHASFLPGFAEVGYQIPWAGTDFANPVSGTSASTPLTASGIALINEVLRRKGQPPLGLLNPWLYQLPHAATFDVTSGNNDLYGVGCCTAKPGYDQATGIGSPNFLRMLKSIRRLH